MNEKKKIIINEILFWKQNQMLPEHYCDYLLALYSQGEEIPIQRILSTSKQTSFLFWLLSIVLIAISLFVIYFTELSFVLQTAILACFVVFLSVVAIYFSKKGNTMPILYVSSAVLLLIFSMELNKYLFGNNLTGLYIMLSLNCVLWMYIGKKLKLLYFSISGWMGAAILIILFLYNVISLR